MQAWAVQTQVAEALPGRGWKQPKISVIKVTLRAVPRSNHEIVFEGVDAILCTRDGRGGRLEWNDRDDKVDRPQSRMNEEGQRVPGASHSAASQSPRAPSQWSGAARSWDGKWRKPRP